MLRKAHADNNVVNSLHDELLCEQQWRSLDNRQMEEMMSKADDRTRMHEQHSHQLEKRLMQVTEMHDASLAEDQAEMEASEALSTPRFNKIETPEFGVDTMKKAMHGHSTPMQTETSSFQIPPDLAKIVDTPMYVYRHLVWARLCQVMVYSIKRLLQQQQQQQQQQARCQD
eukprot:2985658-Amphidinium_carterae.1